MSVAESEEEIKSLLMKVNEKNVNILVAPQK